MEKDEILRQINKIFIDVLEDDKIILTEKSSAADIEAWDSLNHIQIITAIEKFYNIRFDLDDLLNFENVGDLCTGVQNKLK
ncbi:MAG: acyl carrier protein [Ignavibacteriaceae bacterium]|jgi:acyl carrier protein|nr:acyl carrier protein [Ignavibacteriaceae bacterium]